MNSNFWDTVAGNNLARVLITTLPKLNHNMTPKQQTIMTPIDPESLKTLVEDEGFRVVQVIESKDMVILEHD